MSDRRGTLRVRAFAKINLTLRVLGRTPDGYHDLRTVFQEIALHDTLTFRVADGPFSIRCDDALCPTNEENLVWKAADRLWRSTGRRGRLSGVSVTITKRIPSRAGLGGGSSDGAAALRALDALWGLGRTDSELGDIARELGADVPFFLVGGTSLGVERGDRLFPLRGGPSCSVVLVMPGFGVSTADAYTWFDADAPHPRTMPPSVPAGWSIPAEEFGNDLERPVVARHPAIGRLIRSLRRAGAQYAAMSGSGSAVFGLFERANDANAAARKLSARTVRTLVTRTRSERASTVVGLRS